MAVIVKNSFTQTCPQLVELNRGFLLNGHYYRRNTLTPIPFQQFTLKGDKSVVNTARAISNSGWAYTQQEKVWKVSDSENPDITYLFGVYSGDTHVAKILETDNGIELIYDTYLPHNTIGAGSYSGFQRIIKQDKNYIYGVVMGHNNYFSLTKFDKNTLTVSWKYNLGNYTGYKILKIVGDNVFYVAQNDAYTMTTYKWEMANSRVVNVGGTPAYSFGSNNYTASVQGIEIIETIKSPLGESETEYYEEYHFITKRTYYNATVGYRQMPMVSILRLWPNKNDAAWQSSYFPYDLTAADINNKIISTTQAHYSNDWQTHYKTAIKDGVDATEKVFFWFPLYAVDVTEVNKVFCRWHLKKQADGKWFITTYTGMDNTGATLRNVMFNASKDILYVAKYNQCFEIHKWNNTSKNFDKIKEIGSEPYSMGLDDNEYLWLTNLDGLHWFSKDIIPVDIIMQTALTNYSYDDMNINTYIMVGTKELNGSYISSKLRLTISGDAIFDDTNSKTLDVTTSTAELVRVYITITGPGKISITPTFFIN